MIIYIKHNSFLKKTVSQRGKQFPSSATVGMLNLLSGTEILSFSKNTSANPSDTQHE